MDVPNNSVFVSGHNLRTWTAVFLTSSNPAFMLIATREYLQCSSVEKTSAYPVTGVTVTLNSLKRNTRVDDVAESEIDKQSRSQRIVIG